MWKAKLISVIKSKSFDAALEMLKGIEAKNPFEHVYILHRQGRNAEALRAFQNSSLKKSEDLVVKNLLAQIVSSSCFLTLGCRTIN